MEAAKGIVFLLAESQKRRRSMSKRNMSKQGG